MEISLLGPLTAEVRGASVVPTAAKPRQILALLGIHANRVLPVRTLMEEIWGAEPPHSALATLHTYILQLRRRLTTAMGPDTTVGAKGVLVTQYGGYRWEAPPGAVDVTRYEALVAAGRAASEASRHEVASGCFREALALWRGPALVDVRIGPVLRIEVARLEESRLGVLERCLEADLRLGRHVELLSELVELIGHHPLHEGLHAQCMTALYRAGRPWQALDVYQALRRRLVEELGLEPSPRLRRLHQAVLAADPALDEREAPGAGARSALLDRLTG
ncbi:MULTISPECIES: AfsR/SARP family transcriptional regulator [Streptomyces]|uniref:AfsR/SARP family transcriptional regulator n=3 Tax=Streptomyces TaxID=1883 RepID=A0A3Q9FXX9_STRLT|nr:AfsR/SARP family transcriptional regulator [Streptomyces luteoverticillatus]AZQ74563.1 AfsR/SARP family transcriptional regulator [Streptomyces luteoverticillatus]